MSELNKVDPLIIRYGEYVEANLEILFRRPCAVAPFSQWKQLENSAGPADWHFKKGSRPHSTGPASTDTRCASTSTKAEAE
mmetsp:Transcript_51612/g.149989  ORF Transcript_51612/g.149989 Transcript_51612/m.149989 type:complete len:81 (-) Transcript_51612:15-257(-)